MSSDIHIIPSHSINPNKWNACITQSLNGTIYGMAEYLDIMADNWSGLVLNDYEAVMPVPWRKKWGIRYVYTVPFTQQLGWYTITDGHDYDDTFLSAFFSFVKYGDYAFNYANIVTAGKATIHNNFIIPLSRPYAHIAANYKTDTLNNLKKASRNDLVYQPADFQLVIQQYQNMYGSRMAHITANDYANFTTLATTFQNKNMVFARQVISHAGEVLANAIFLQDSKRIYNVMNNTTGNGKKTAANHFLLDNILKEFAGSGLIFDFEGSDIPGIQSFYEKFGAVNQPYTKLERFNRLPFPLRLLKR